MVVDTAKVWAEPEEVTSILKPVDTEVAKVCTCVVKPLREVKALPPTKVEVETKYKPPAPSVTMGWPTEPAALGRVKVTLAACVEDDCKVEV